MENEITCESCASPMRAISQCDDTFFVCDSCRTVFNPCPMCGEKLPNENVLGDEMAVCNACGYPVKGPWDNDTRDPNITATVKLVCTECNDLFILKEVVGHARRKELASATPGYDHLDMMMSAAGPTDFQCYEGTCPRCRKGESVLLDTIDGIAIISGKKTGNLNSTGVIKISPPPKVHTRER